MKCGDPAMIRKAAAIFVRLAARRVRVDKNTRMTCAFG
jgi:hypothetical protein